MSIDEAIKHCEEVMVENLEKTKDRNSADPVAIQCFECADEHRQLAEWLKELKAIKEDGDCISRQAAIDAMNEWEWQELYLPIHFKQLLEDLPPVKPEQKWIPVSERLPEKNDVYLVAINSYGCPTRDVDGFVSQSVRKWEMYGKSVVAWMPLPEPYKASPTGAERSDKE